MNLRDAAQAALNAMQSFESGTNGLYEGEFAEEIAALKAALAEPVQEPVQEPVAWMSPASQSMIGRDDGNGSAYHIITISKATGNHTIPLYIAPPQRKPLTEEEIDAEWRKAASEEGFTTVQFVRNFARAIERTHGITS